MTLQQYLSTFPCLSADFRESPNSIPVYGAINEPRREKTCLRGLRPGKTQTAQPQRLARGLKFWIYDTIYCVSSE